MKKRFPLALCGMVLWFSPFSEHSLGEEKGTQKPEISFDQIPDLLRKPDESVKAKADALVSVVDAEVKAKRVAPGILQSLRTAVMNVNPETGLDAQKVLTNVSLPTDNEAVANAVNAFQEASAAAQNQRPADFRVAMNAILKRITELTRDAKSPQDVDPVLAVVEFFQTWAQRVRSNAAYNQLNSLSNCGNFLRSLSRVLNLHSTDDPAVISGALRNFLGLGQSAKDFVSEEEVRKRIAKILDPIKTAVEASENALTEALIVRKPSAEVFAALSAFEEAAKRFAASSAMLDMQGARQADRNNTNYKTLAETARSVEMRHWDEARQGIPNAKQAIRQIEGKRTADMEALAAAWEKEMNDGAAAESRQVREQVRAMLAKVKTPADLETVAVEIDGMETKASPRRNPSSVEGISNELRALAAAWQNPQPNAFAQQRYNESNGRRSPFAKKMSEIRDRIERDVLAQSLHAPELAEAPFAALSREAAIQSLVEKLASDGQWRRLLNLLEAQSLAARMLGGQISGTGAAASIRSFLAAQNFELAEQWTDAAASYKTVLRNAEENTPVKESALRLKTLAKEHPKEVQAAQAQATPEIPQDSRIRFENSFREPN